MKLHEKKFNEILELLKSKLGSKISVSEEHGTTSLCIEDSHYWLSTDAYELTVGFSLGHQHFSEEYEVLKKGIEQAFKLLTCEIRITEYKKGETVFKVITDVKNSDSSIENIGITGVLVYPFWKKTRIETTYFERILDPDEIASEMNQILNFNE
ncbi:hypothetical protein [Chryseobacterium rhizosphaerae]|uniref:Uncharacterized protein n=1 Tax=Chryseobacterium rhizosphaerae TaxID=395937 RepID=A0ABX9IJC2_9FLAO|nr:hypothetical protein [Chryseobacterium rhizosphaerae]REC74728.1 hypothetical protein DRF57_13345 [Chryseobacterium rhizosphaerae]GEN66225.1 hypothetical protein CRH01_07930 [Chryseobacterium rhizosphaerae]